MTEPATAPVVPSATPAPAAPAVVAPPPAPAATAPVTPPAPAADSVTLPREAFNQRLRESQAAGQKEFLKTLGFDTPEALSAVLKVAKDAQSASMTEAQRQQAEIDALKPKAALAERLQPAYARMVNSVFDALPESIRTAIDDVAKGDPEQRANMIDVFRKAGMVGGPAATPPAPGATPGATPPHPALATTTPPGAPPPPAASKTAYDTWQELEKSSPTKATIFYDANRVAIEKSRPADA
jgi:hypothetical protein